MRASAATAREESTPISSAASHDAYSTPANEMTGLDFDFGDMADFNTASGSAGLTPGVFSEDSTSLNTPMTTDWSWLDASSTETEGCALAQAMLAQDQVDWNDLLYSPYEKYWDSLPNMSVRNDVFDVESEFGRISY